MSPSPTGFDAMMNISKDAVHVAPETTFQYMLLNLSNVGFTECVIRMYSLFVSTTGLPVPFQVEFNIKPEYDPALDALVIPVKPYVLPYP